MFSTVRYWIKSASQILWFFRLMSPCLFAFQRKIRVWTFTEGLPYLVQTASTNSWLHHMSNQQHNYLVAIVPECGTEDGSASTYRTKLKVWQRDFWKLSSERTLSYEEPFQLLLKKQPLSSPYHRTSIKSHHQSVDLSFAAHISPSSNLNYSHTPPVKHLHQNLTIRRT